MDNQSVTNLSYLREIAMDDDSIVIETAETFLDDMPAALKSIQKHAKDEEWQQLYKQAHKIKPNLQYMGMDKAHELILDIENQAKTEDIADDLEAKVSEFSALCTQAFEELTEKLKSLRE